MATRNTDRNRQERISAVQASIDAATTDTARLRGRPANENDPATAMMLAKLRRPPSYAVYFGAFGLSLVWLFGWFLLNSNAIFFPPNNQAPTWADAMRAMALLIVPITAIFVMAYFLWRAQQLRQVSEALMQSALRLVRPTDIASENLTSPGSRPSGRRRGACLSARHGVGRNRPQGNVRCGTRLWCE
jgi:hypothetical protein